MVVVAVVVVVVVVVVVGCCDVDVRIFLFYVVTVYVALSSCVSPVSASSCFNFSTMPPAIDIDSHEGHVDWAAVWLQCRNRFCMRFAI